MKKLLAIFCLGIFIVNFVFAVQGNSGNNEAGLQTKTKMQAGDYTLENGKSVQIQEKERNRIRIKAGNYSADCDCNLTQEKVQQKTKVHMQMSNGRNAEIKVMPDTASETALARLRLKVCAEANNCTIQLKEVGKGNETRAVYELQRNRESKVLGMFKKQMRVQAHVDAENGEIIGVKKPWWAFLASEKEETEAQ